MLLNCMIIMLVVHFICLAQVFSLNVDGKYFFPYLVLFFWSGVAGGFFLLLTTGCYFSEFLQSCWSNECPMPHAHTISLMILNHPNFFEDYTIILIYRLMLLFFLPTGTVPWRIYSNVVRLTFCR